MKFIANYVQGKLLLRVK